jgi:P-type Ca2+ transporter type 2C
LSLEGLSSVQAAARLAAEGPNRLPAAERRGTAALAADVLREPMLLLLLAAAGLYLAVGDLHEALVLAASIVVVVAITVLQERKAERALEALRELASPRALVVRDGELTRIAGAEVVRGDLVVLGEGGRVPADARLAPGAGVELDESLLTGESLPVAKRAGEAVFSGTLVVRGQGRAQVFATGAKSELGRIGVSLAALEPGKTSLELETARIVKLVALFAIGLSLAMAAAHFVLRGDWIASLLAGLTLAMAILPEEFPVILAVFLALGAWRISRRGVLTRRMPALEMLGAATVLCVDKTGTLTENRMRVLDTPQAAIDVAALACELDPHDPMDRAIVDAAGAQVVQFRKDARLEKTYPLTDRFLAVCQAWRLPQGALHVAVKGAPETVLPLCGDPVGASLDDARAAAARGMRVLAVAEAVSDGEPLADPAGYPLRFVGFVKLADPLRPSVPDAVAQCRGAGIRVVMITGDFPGTALRIAADAGIDVSGGALTGRDIAALEEAALAQAVRGVSVFARVRPEQKLRLVQAYRAAGEVVAMTGDGVNDAPALKAAHIGIAMGRRGTDVARESAHLVLLEDDFGSIVDTVRLGRRIYDNIRNAMRYIISVHVPTAGMSFLPLAIGGPLFLFPVHVVFLEFVIDPACTLVYEAEKTDAHVMRRPPRDPREPLFNLNMLGVSLALGASMLAAVLAAYAWALYSGRSPGETRAVAFAAIVFANIALLFATRSRERSAAAMLREPNAALWWITAGALGALLASIYVEPVAGLFRFEPISAADLGLAAAAGLLGVAWYELRKLLRRRRPG